MLYKKSCGKLLLQILEARFHKENPISRKNKQGFDFPFSQEHKPLILSSLSIHPIHLLIKKKICKFWLY